MRHAVPTRVVVGATDTLPDILSKLRTATGGAATIAIPGSSSLFLTASEFRALKATTETARITLTVETDDRLRRQLASMFQMPVVDLLPGALIEPEPAQVMPGPEPEPLRPTTLPELPKIDLLPAQEVSPRWTPQDKSEPEEYEEEPTRPRRPLLPFAPKWLGIGVGVVVLLAVASIAAAYLLQTATVTITTTRQPVSAEVAFAAVSLGAPTPAGALFSVPASPVTVEVQYRGTIPVTGEIREPDQVATGRVALRNPSENAVEIAAGTQFAARDGVEYSFVADVTVPPVDADGAGRAEAEIHAVGGGEAGNREIGLLSGQLENGVYFSNRDVPVSGGTDKITRIVDQKDIDQLVANANEQLPQRVVGEPLADGRVVLPGTVQAGEISYTTDHLAGDVAENVTIDATMVLNAMAFDPAEAEAQGAIQLQEGLQTSTPEGFELESETLSYASPILVNDQGESALFRLVATANARAMIDSETRDQLAESVAGMDVEEAEVIVQQHPHVDLVEISSSPGFLPVRIPGDVGRVKVETK